MFYGQFPNLCSPPGNAEKLVSQGFLNRLTKSKQTKAEKAAAAKALKAAESNIEYETALKEK